VQEGLTAFGPFFPVGSHPPGALPPPPWRPLSELFSPSGPLADRVAATRAALASRAGVPVDALEPRVAASTVHLGLAARLAAPALGAAVLGCPLDLRADGLWWQEASGGPVPLSVPVACGRHRDQAAGVSGHPPPGAGGQEPGPAEWDRRLVDEVLAPMTAAVTRLVPVSGRVLWGNIASAVNTAAAQVARQRPDLAAGAWQAAARLFASPRLAGERNPPGPAFRRSSCCLFYRLAPGDRSAVCGDCVLRGRAR
jgi:Ferric iron reductase FhuF-like transporter/FhuF 2Fe-2S C-terminal domain